MNILITCLIMLLHVKENIYKYTFTSGINTSYVFHKIVEFHLKPKRDCKKIVLIRHQSSVQYTYTNFHLLKFVKEYHASQEMTFEYKTRAVNGKTIMHSFIHELFGNA